MTPAPVTIYSDWTDIRLYKNEAMTRLKSNFFANRLEHNISARD